MSELIRVHGTVIDYVGRRVYIVFASDRVNCCLSVTCLVA